MSEMPEQRRPYCLFDEDGVVRMSEPIGRFSVGTSFTERLSPQDEALVARKRWKGPSDDVLLVAFETRAALVFVSFFASTRLLLAVETSVPFAHALALAGLGGLPGLIMASDASAEERDVAPVLCEAAYKELAWVKQNWKTTFYPLDGFDGTRGLLSAALCRTARQVAAFAGAEAEVLCEPLPRMAEDGFDWRLFGSFLLVALTLASAHAKGRRAVLTLSSEACELTATLVFESADKPRRTQDSAPGGAAYASAVRHCVQTAERLGVLFDVQEGKTCVIRFTAARADVSLVGLKADLSWAQEDFPSFFCDMLGEQKEEEKQ